MEWLCLTAEYGRSLKAVFDQDYSAELIDMQLAVKGYPSFEHRDLEQNRPLYTFWAHAASEELRPIRVTLAPRR